MSQFTRYTMKRLRRYQCITMAQMLGYPSSKSKNKSDTIEWVHNFAHEDEEKNQRAWTTFFSVRDGKVVQPDAAPAAEVNLDAIKIELQEHVDNFMAESLRTAESKMGTHRPVEVITGGTKKKLKDVLPAVFDKTIALASQRVNVLMTGPAGCGKTWLGAKIAEALNMTFGSISCSAGMSESQLAGWLLPTAKAGQFEYVASTFVKCYETGGVFLFDELDAADPNALTFINSAIANDGFHIPQRFKKPFVKKHKDFICLAAANTYGHGADTMYVGRNQLDAATLDRFRAGMIIMDYDSNVEQSLVEADVLAWGLKIREHIKTHNLRRVMSTRLLLDLSKMKRAYKWDKPKWEQTYFADWTKDEMRRVRDGGVI